MIKNPYPGKFIVFEGLDGSGKSTQARALVEYLQKQNYQAYAASEPTGSSIGLLVRDRLAKKWTISSECLELLFAADRGNHLDKEIEPRLKKGVTVVCDRYFLSSLAYGSLENEFDWIKDLNSKFIMPDFVIYLEVSPVECVRRIKKERHAAGLYEKLDILGKVAQNYKKAFLKLSPADLKVVVIKGEGEQHEVADRIVAAIGELIIKKPR